LIEPQVARNPHWGKYAADRTVGGANSHLREGMSTIDENDDSQGEATKASEFAVPDRHYVTSQKEFRRS
jgi:hypothetical protein